MKWGNFSRFKKLYSPGDISEVLEMAIDRGNVIKNNKKIKYYNIPCSFDIETSSFFRSTGTDDEKVAIMYEWSLGINGAVIIGRTWDEFLEVYKIMVETLNLCKEFRLIMYVHNLSYEFQFMRKWFEWENIFSLNLRKPCYALTMEGMEFRCSYLLSGYNLKKLGENLRRYPVQKMVGDLDYSLIRHTETNLTEKEIKYCENDVRVVMSFIQEKIEDDGDITRIPLTKTGYVRNYCRNMCLYEGSHKKNVNKYFNYRKLMEALTVTPEEYSQLKRAFQGGFTHANAQYSGVTLENVGSFDLVSSYPYAMVSEKFPMSRGKKVKINSEKEFNDYLKSHCCLFDIEFDDIYSTSFIEHPISSSRCYKKEIVVEDNGRVVSAKRLMTTITELDYKIIKKFYEWGKMRIYNFVIYKKSYLPTDFVKSILKLYKDKTQLKGVEGKEIEYLKSKEMLNSCYGMAVTDICREEISYEKDEWDKEPPELTDSLKKYNRAKRRFLFYPWGVWVTAYARMNLFTGILEFGGDYVYSDTDSVKGANVEKHLPYIDKFNSVVRKKLEKVSEFHGVDFSDFEPSTIEDKKKLLGVWEDEGIYTRFKTLGAKRYMIEKGGKIDLTVSGVNKKLAMPHLIKKYGDKVFEAFDHDLHIPQGFTGKSTHAYLDEEKEGSVKDYEGNTHTFFEKSAVHLEPADYTLSLSSAYVDYLKGMETFEK